MGAGAARTHAASCRNAAEVGVKGSHGFECVWGQSRAHRGLINGLAASHTLDSCLPEYLCGNDPSFAA